MPNYSAIRDGYTARDRADVENFRNKAVNMSYAGETWPINPEQSKLPLSDSELLHAAEAAERLHMTGDLYGGLGAETYQALVDHAQRLRSSMNLPYADPNARLRPQGE